MGPQERKVGEAAALNFLGRLEHLVKSCESYGDHHATVQGAATMAAGLLREVPGNTPLWVTEGRVVLGERVLRASTGMAGTIAHLQQFLSARGVGALEVSGPVTPEGLIAWVRLLLQPEATERTIDGHHAAAEAAGLRGLRLRGTLTRAQGAVFADESDPALLLVRLILRGARVAAQLNGTPGVLDPIQPAQIAELASVSAEIVDLVESRTGIGRLALDGPEMGEPAGQDAVRRALLAVAIGESRGLAAVDLGDLAALALLYQPTAGNQQVITARLIERMDLGRMVRRLAIASHQLWSRDTPHPWAGLVLVAEQERLAEG
jgi:hypothetical protein